MYVYIFKCGLKLNVKSQKKGFLLKNITTINTIQYNNCNNPLNIVSVVKIQNFSFILNVYKQDYLLS